MRPILNSLFKREDINAVQIVNKNFLNKSFKIKKNVVFQNEMKKKYDNTIDESTLKSWRKPFKKAQEYNIGLLTFSDNPYEENSSKHGLYGIGKQYTWIKMKQDPDLESLRQAFLVPSLRIKNCYESPIMPYNPPDSWIKRITFRNTSITKTDESFTVEFSPQMTTIIGGRGSGKSSIIRFIRGILKKQEDLNHGG